MTEQKTKSTTRGYLYKDAGPQNTAMGSEHPGKIPSFENMYEKRKWIKQHMAAAFRVFARCGFTEGTAGHISVRNPIDEHTFWINPLGIHFSLIKASDMVRVDYHGNIVEGENKAIIRAGFAIHSSLHQARPDVHAACHCHTVDGKAYSTICRPLEMLNQDVCAFYKAHAVYDDFGGVAMELDEGIAIARALGDGRGAILRNHGLITVGRTVDEAAYLLMLMDKSCRIQMQIDQYCAVTGFKKHLIGDEEASYTKHMQADYETLFAEFQPEYNAELTHSGGDFLG
ncbi:uncharacterized protein PRCAT00004247001 [Priceomyces carsonii]|uniref:uncharacterized protein n=1 Tax=Priceomyces carsonii TaxID=28549 RepID=UPI002ED83ABC|nr:unnamed protein product [Priceomyces carsonii]